MAEILTSNLKSVFFGRILRFHIKPNNLIIDGTIHSTVSVSEEAIHLISLFYTISCKPLLIDRGVDDISMTNETGGHIRARLLTCAKNIWPKQLLSYINIVWKQDIMIFSCFLFIYH